MIRRFAERPREGKPGYLTSALPDYHLLRPNVVAIPLRLANTPPAAMVEGTAQGSMFGSVREAPETANLSATARAYIATLTHSNPDEDHHSDGQSGRIRLQQRILPYTCRKTMPGYDPTSRAFHSLRRSRR